MKRELSVWLFFIVFLRILSYSLCESAFCPKSGEKSFLKPEKRLNCLYERFVKPNREGEQRRYGADQEANPSKIIRKGGGRSVYGGANDIKRPHTVHNGENTFLIKSTSGLLVLLGHVVLPLLNLVFFF